MSLRRTHLFDPLQQREQPVLINLTVTVKEGQDSCLCHVCPSDSGPDQTCSGTHHISCHPDGWAMSPGSSSTISCTQGVPWALTHQNPIWIKHGSGSLSPSQCCKACQPSPRVTKANKWVHLNLQFIAFMPILNLCNYFCYHVLRKNRTQNASIASYR